VEVARLPRLAQIDILIAGRDGDFSDPRKRIQALNGEELVPFADHRLFYLTDQRGYFIHPFTSPESLSKISRLRSSPFLSCF